MSNLSPSELEKLGSDLKAVSTLSLAESRLQCIRKATPSQKLVPSRAVLLHVGDWVYVELKTGCVPTRKIEQYHRARIAIMYLDIISNRLPIELLKEQDLKLLQYGLDDLRDVVQDAIAWARRTRRNHSKKYGGNVH